MNGILLAVWLSACSADAASTHVALKRGAYEVMLSQDSRVNTLIIGSQAVVLPLALSKMKNRKVATVLTYVLIGMRVAAVVNNIHVLRALP